ncbi:hypothetical protein FK530_23180 [Tsukamurella conjunctivitidis]|uniref:Uncharacterized protein n=1 Tax=Tsukamurella conjunctivitidis TaxID=2592068 RepID=A0A5C5RSK2_9ACTN|nr:MULTISPECIES: hypothetical protein [Tsukamurella]RDB48844.1 hypothetical protein DVB87_05985 [Tsukamurella tyrosinosolvens]TWS25530.1 hypothetical protein FK530_23180 [Tsukamurella conjunctivitidis]
MVDNHSQYGGAQNPVAYTRALDEGAAQYPSDLYSDEPTAHVPHDPPRPYVDERPIPLNVGRFAAGVAGTAVVGVGLALLLTFLLNELYQSVGAPWATHPRDYVAVLIGVLALTVLSAATFLLLVWQVDTPTLIYAWLAGLVSAAGLLVPWLTGGPSWAGFLVGLTYAVVAMTVTGLIKSLGAKGLQLAAQRIDSSPVPLNVGRFAAGMGATALVGAGVAVLLTFLLNQLYTSVGAPWALAPREYTSAIVVAAALTVASATTFLLLAWLVDTPTLIYAWLASLVSAAGLLVPWLTGGPSWAGFLVGLAYAVVALTITGLTKALGNQALRNQSFQQREVI